MIVAPSKVFRRRSSSVREAWARPRPTSWPRPGSGRSSSTGSPAPDRAPTKAPSAGSGRPIPIRPRSGSACEASTSSPNWKERHGDDLEWHKGGYSYVAYRPEEEKSLKDLLVVQKSYGLNISWLDPKEIQEAIPGINPDGLIGGTLSPDDGHASPLLAVAGLLFPRPAPGRRVPLRRNGHWASIIEGGTGPGRPDGQGGIRRGDRHQRRRRLGRRGRRASPGSSVPVRPDQHEGAVTEPVARFLEPMVVDIRPGRRIGELLFLSARDRTGGLLHHPVPEPLGVRHPRDERVPPDGGPAHGGPDPPAREPPGPPDLARPLPHDARRPPHHRMDERGRGLLLAVGMCGQGFMLGPGVGELIVRMVRRAAHEAGRGGPRLRFPIQGIQGTRKAPMSAARSRASISAG